MEHLGERENWRHRYGLRRHLGRTLWLSTQGRRVGMAWEGGGWRVLYFADSAGDSTGALLPLTPEEVFRDFTNLLRVSGPLGEAQIQLCFGDGAPHLGENLSSPAQDSSARGGIPSVSREIPLWVQGLESDLDALFVFDSKTWIPLETQASWEALLPAGRALTPAVHQLLDEFSIKAMPNQGAIHVVVPRVLTSLRVLSIQRLPLPEGGGFSASNASQKLADFYFYWIEVYFLKVIRAYRSADTVTLCLATPWIPLIRLKVLSLPPEGRGSSKNPGEWLQVRSTFRVVGGWLAASEQTGVLEFQVINRSWAFAILRDFRPALPGWIYRLTQALFHAWVMDAFGQALQSPRAQRLLRKFEVQKKLNYGDR